MRITEDEFLQLVESARSSKKRIQEFDGEERARIYLLSCFTGLRKAEIASLTPRSFSLTSTPPTVTVEAAFSKHGERDVLPLHPELAKWLAVWLAGLPVDEVLFPRLKNRRTSVMVRKDLERVGIPYETPDGTADFHAAGRHTHITQLLRNGASLPETRRLARHSDIRTTMRYTHIGIEDQARALKQLPWPGNGKQSKSENTEGSGNGWECSGSDSAVSSSRTESKNGSDTIPADETESDASPKRVRSCRKSSRHDIASREISHGFDSRRLHFW